MELRPPVSASTCSTIARGEHDQVISVTSNKGTTAPPSAPWMSRGERYVLGKQAIYITVIDCNPSRHRCAMCMPAVLGGAIGRFCAIQQERVVCTGAAERCFVCFLKLTQHKTIPKRNIILQVSRTRRGKSKCFIAFSFTLTDHEPALSRARFSSPAPAS